MCQVLPRVNLSHRFASDSDSKQRARYTIEMRKSSSSYTGPNGSLPLRNTCHVPAFVAVVDDVGDVAGGGGEEADSAPVAAAPPAGPTE